MSWRARAINAASPGSRSWPIARAIFDEDILALVSDEYGDKGVVWLRLGLPSTARPASARRPASSHP